MDINKLLSHDSGPENDKLAMKRMNDYYNERKDEAISPGAQKSPERLSPHIIPRYPGMATPPVTILDMSNGQGVVINHIEPEKIDETFAQPRKQYLTTTWRERAGDDDSVSSVASSGKRRKLHTRPRNPSSIAPSPNSQNNPGLPSFRPSKIASSNFYSGETHNTDSEPQSIKGGSTDNSKASEEEVGTGEARFGLRNLSLRTCNDYFAFSTNINRWTR